MNVRLQLCAVLILTSSAVSAQQKQFCPIEIQRTNSLHYVSKDIDRLHSGLRIEFVNRAQLNTAAVEFGVVFTNLLGEQQQSRSMYEQNTPVKPGQLHKSDWSDSKYTKGQPGLKAMAWVERVGFADGSVWQDDGSRSCGMLEQIQEPKVYQPPATASAPGAAPTASAPSGTDKDPVSANIAAARNSAAQQSVTQQMGHTPTPDELARLVQQGKASRCAVVTTPAGAEVLVDGNSAGVTPIVLVLLKHDTPRTVTIKKQGYRTMEKQFDPDGKDIPVEVTLVKE